MLSVADAIRGRAWAAVAALGVPLLTNSPAWAARTVYLLFGDGVTAVPAGHSCEGSTVPPAYQCWLGVDDIAIATCKQQIQGYLDRFYADFDVEFVAVPPSSGRFYTVAVTSSWPECAPDGDDNGRAQLSCNDFNGNVAYAFDCGSSAKSCATTIAHEHGHLVGLEHTSSDADIMWPHTCETCDGFAKDALGIEGTSHCRRTEQSSYQMMLARLGKSPATPKGGLRCVDEAEPLVLVARPSLAEVVIGRTVAVEAEAADECGVRFVEFAIDGKSRRDYTPPFHAELPLPKKAELVLEVTVEDNTGHRTSVTRAFRQDLEQRPPDPEPEPEPNSCLCRAPGVGAARSNWPFLALALAVSVARRRRRTTTKEEA